MRNFIEKLKEFIYYLVCKKLPATEYAVGAVDSFDNTITIIKKGPWTFTLMEAAKLFFSRYAETAICIAITSILWSSYGERMATTLFYAFDMPNWMLPICLCGALKIFSRVLGEVGSCLGAN